MAPDREAAAHLRHELRTPLNHIIGYGEMLIEDAETSGAASLKQPLDALVDGAKRLLDMVNDHLSQARVESGETHIEHLPDTLSAPLDGIIAAAGTLAAAADGGDPHLLSDVARISSAADHLRDLIRHGVLSRPALARLAIRSEKNAVSPLTPGANGAILVVDDNESNREMLSRRLAREGYADVTLAADGRAALESLGLRKFDLVLLDIMMPGVNGYQVLEAMKSDPDQRDIPVIMISALDDMASVIRCIELGAEDYLPKPFDPTLLRARVGACLEKKALRDEIVSWGQKLEERVNAQVAQLDRLGRLKGFFSPQLAEVIVGGGGEELLKTHRAEVVVVFLDLRGFTAFTDSAEPEEVMSVLSEYHRTLGQLVLAHEGTIERFAGDGIMIFFNDPIKLANPAVNAARMALDMQQKFVPLRAAWKKRGFDLDLGIGIAQGYATLGAIGFEGRWDYACIGSVTNLAARLCGEAKGGQILTSQKTLARIEDTIRMVTENAELDFTDDGGAADEQSLTQANALGNITLKGLAQPVAVFNITGIQS